MGHSKPDESNLMKAIFNMEIRIAEIEWDGLDYSQKMLNDIVVDFERMAICELLRKVYDI